MSSKYKKNLKNLKRLLELDNYILLEYKNFDIVFNMDNGFAFKIHSKDNDIIEYLNTLSDSNVDNSLLFDYSEFDKFVNYEVKKQEKRKEQESVAGRFKIENV